MKMDCIYINGIGNISPQNTFDESMGEAIAQPEGSFFVCQEPEYKEFIQRKLLRRMSRAVRMGLAVAYKSLKEAKDPSIDAIVTGTAWGCVKETEKFLETIIENSEQYLTPTAFVQSTHNTVAGQIALMHHNNCYNMSYVQGSVSFESALIDVILLFMDGKVSNVLAAGIDEQTEQLKILLKRLTCASQSQPMGEGAACFVLSNQKEEYTYAKLTAVNMLYRPQNSQALENQIQSTLENANINPEEINLILTGYNIPSFRKLMFPDVHVFNYKQLCGNYPTSTAFAMALGAKVIKSDPKIKTIIGLTKTPNNIMIYNQVDNIHHSIIILSKI